MPNKNKSTTLYSIHIPLVAVALLLGVAAYTAFGLSSDSDVLGKNTSNKGQEKKVEASSKKDNKDTNKSNKSTNSSRGGKPTDVDINSSSNAVEHKNKVDKVVGNLKVKAEKVKESTMTDQPVDEETAEDVEEAVLDVVTAAVEQEETVDDTAEAIAAVESKPKWQVLLFGSDYKNLGKLRSSLAHTENSIRKLERSSDLGVFSSDTEVTSDLATLYAERERIRNVIVENESQFSILGWVNRFLSNYTFFGGSSEDAPLEVEETTESTDTVDIDDTSDTTESTESQ